MEFSYYVTLSQSTLRDKILIRPLEFLKSTSPETVSGDSWWVFSPFKELFPALRIKENFFDNAMGTYKAIRHSVRRRRTMGNSAFLLARFVNWRAMANLSNFTPIRES